MLPFPLPRVFSPVRCDDGSRVPATVTESSAKSGAISTLKQAVKAPESELKRWHRVFDANAKVAVGDQR